MDNEIHGARIEDIQEIIDKAISKMCSNYPSLNYENIKDDASQECWLAVLDAADKYIPMGYKFTTFAFSAIRWKLMRVMDHEIRRGNRYELTDVLPESGDEEEASEITGLFLDVKDGDVLFLYLSGFLVKEIAELMPDREVSMSIIEAARQEVQDKLQLARGY